MEIAALALAAGAIGAGYRQAKQKLMPDDSKDGAANANAASSSSSSASTSAAAATGGAEFGGSGGANPDSSLPPGFLTRRPESTLEVRDNKQELPISHPCPSQPRSRPSFLPSIFRPFTSATFLKFVLKTPYLSVHISPLVNIT
jgi:hypothetical protein